MANEFEARLGPRNGRNRLEILNASQETANFAVMIAQENGEVADINPGQRHAFGTEMDGSFFVLDQDEIQVDIELIVDETRRAFQSFSFRAHITDNREIGTLELLGEEVAVSHEPIAWKLKKLN